MKLIQSALRQSLLTSAYVVSSAVAVSLTSANAALIMTVDNISDESGPLEIFDGGELDSNPNSGVITFSGSVGSFYVNTVTGVGEQSFGMPRIDLNSIDLSQEGGQLEIGLTNTDLSFTEATRKISAAVGGTTDGAVDFRFYLDKENRAFGGEEIFELSEDDMSLNHPFSGAGNAYLEDPELFSMSILVGVTHSDGAKSTSFNAGIVPVSAPPGTSIFIGSCAWLLLRYRTKKQQNA